VDKVSALEHQRKASPILVSIVPNMFKEEGHYYAYHVAVGRAAMLLGWRYSVILPVANDLEILPSGWEAVLSNKGHYRLINDSLVIRTIKKLIDSSVFGISLFRHLKKQEYQGANALVFLFEGFTELELFVFSLVAFFSKTIGKKNRIWVFYRTDVYNYKLRGLICKLANFFLVKKVGNKNLQLLTDSDLLFKSLSGYFKRHVYTMPIPHIEVQTRDIMEIIERKIAKDKIVMWWPGSPRSEKGLRVIQNMVRLRGDNTKNFVLIASKKACIKSVQGGVNVVLIDDLNRQDYLNQLYNSDLILLPYDPLAYQCRTSGIFVECVMAGKPPVVTRGTWMAFELEKYHLHDLVIDYGSDDILSKFEDIVNDCRIKERLLQMSNDYSRFHGERGFAYRMKELLLI
jgi:hypothetical protein